MGMQKDTTFFVNVLNSYYNYLRKRVICKSTPSIFWIEPTNACNLICPMCPTTYASPDTKKGFISFELFKKIIDEISDFVLESKLLQGGEPLLHPQIAEMVEYMKLKGVRTEIDSNGTLLTEKLARNLIEAGLDFISFSFDGYDKETYESIRIKAVFDKTIENILVFLEAKKRLKRKNPYVRIKSIVQKDKRFSEDKKKKFMQRFGGLPVDEFDITEAFNWGNEKVAASKVYSLGKVKKIEINEKNERFYHPCQRLWTTMSILWDGTVVPCCQDFYGEYKLGNINEKSILEIWNDEPIQLLRTKNIKKEVVDLPLCSKCSIFFTPTVFSIPTYFYGFPSLLKRILGYGLYQKLNHKLSAKTKISKSP